MKITLQNQELTTAIKLLQRLELRPGDSRSRTKLVKLLTEAVEAYDQDTGDLLAGFANKDEDGEPIMLDKGHYDVPKDKLAELSEERTKLNEEERIIEGGMYARNIDQMPGILRGITETLSGAEADIYDKLLDQLEEQEAAVKAVDDTKDKADAAKED